MNNVIDFPSTETQPEEKKTAATVMDAVFIARLAAANAVTRKLREWKIDVNAVSIPRSFETMLPMLELRVNSARPLAPLLEATAGTRTYRPAVMGIPDRMVAVMDDVFVVWYLRDRRAQPRGVKTVRRAA